MDKIAIIGLGYVGLPLAVEFAKKYTVVGFDIFQARIDELKKGYDRTLELTAEELQESINQGIHLVPTWMIFVVVLSLLLLFQHQ